MVCVVCVMFRFVVDAGRSHDDKESWSFTRVFVLRFPDPRTKISVNKRALPHHCSVTMKVGVQGSMQSQQMNSTFGKLEHESMLACNGCTPHAVKFMAVRTLALLLG